MNKYLLALLVLVTTGMVAGNNPLYTEAAEPTNTTNPISVSLTATAVSSDTIILDINASSTEGNITKLEIYRDGVLIDILYPGGEPPRGLRINSSK